MRGGCGARPHAHRAALRNAALRRRQSRVFARCRRACSLSIMMGNGAALGAPVMHFWMAVSESLITPHRSAGSRWSAPRVSPIRRASRIPSPVCRGPHGHAPWPERTTHPPTRNSAHER